MAEIKKRVVLIAGPTASGKSALALALAERTGGVVVNADSMQIYAEMRVLTARPTDEDLARAEHRLYGHVPAAEVYTVLRWLEDVEPVLADILGSGRPAIIVGGTGLYFNAICNGLSPVPPVPAVIRDSWRAIAKQLAPGALHAELASRDPIGAQRLFPNDHQRILRALEVVDATGRPLHLWQSERSTPLIGPGEGIRLVIAPERELLRQRIADRFRIMVEQGGLDEARAVAALGLDPILPSMKAIGVPEMIAAATGIRVLDEAVSEAITATRQYAKRQETWFRNQMPDWKRLEFTSARNFLSATEEIAQQMK